MLIIVFDFNIYTNLVSNEKKGVNLWKTTEAYRKKAQARLDEIGAKINQLKAKAEQADADARIQALKEIDQLKERKKEMQTQLDKLKESGEAAFDEIKAGTEDAINSLKSAVDKAVSKFQ